MWSFLRDVSEKAGISVADLVSSGIAAFSALVGLVAAIAAWRAASASAKSAKEMVRARNQYVRPMLVLEPFENSRIELAKRPSGGTIHGVLRHSSISMKNCGRGPAYDVRVSWWSESVTMLDKDRLHIDNINEILAPCMLSAQIEPTFSGNMAITIRSVDDGQTQSSILLEPVRSEYHFDVIAEGEIVKIPIPQEILLTHIILSLNDLALKNKQANGGRAYGYHSAGKSASMDVLSISAKSITEERISYELRGRSSGGTYLPSAVKEEGIRWYSALEYSFVEVGGVLRTISESA